MYLVTFNCNISRGFSSPMRIGSVTLVDATILFITLRVNQLTYTSRILTCVKTSLFITHSSTLTSSLDQTMIAEGEA
ncbi:unnamed protein product [Auanema sp. JU1783]|nr:unnamed protein product [Auanema sp. JU1783]